MKGFFCKITLALCFVIFVGSAARADEVTFSANAPMVVTAGESFRVEFSLNATPDDDSFEAPDFGAFDVLAGPAISQGHSIQIINGAMTKNVNYTITYVLLAQDAGNITIGPASIKVDKKRYKTQPLPIEISDKPSAGSAGLRREIQTLRMKVSRRKPRDRLPKTICCCASTYRNSRSSKANPCWRPSSSTAGWRSWATKTLNSPPSTASGRRTSTFRTPCGSVKP